MLRGGKQGTLQFEHAPVLSVDSPNLVWDWGFDNPPFWEIQTSLDSGATWIFFGDYGPEDRATGAVPLGNQYRMYGIDPDQNPVTQTSNIVGP